MKKVFLAIAVVALCGGMVSCKKKCTCTVYAGDVKTTSSFDAEDIPSGYSCSDYSDFLKLADDRNKCR